MDDKWYNNVYTITGGTKKQIKILAKKFPEILIGLINDDYDYEAMKILKFVDPNIQDEYGSTALIYATSYGKLSIVKELIREGADPNIENTYGETALWFGNKNLEMCKLLVENGAEVTDNIIQNTQDPIIKKYLESVYNKLNPRKSSPKNSSPKKSSPKKSEPLYSSIENVTIHNMKKNDYIRLSKKYANNERVLNTLNTWATIICKYDIKFCDELLNANLFGKKSKNKSKRK